MNRLQEPGNTHLSVQDFNRLSTFIQNHYGIQLPPEKRTLLEGRLRKRMRELQETSFARYCQYLFTERGMEEELPHMIDAVTTNKTDFFREPAHFKFLVESALPSILNNTRHTRGKRINAWSAASSTGEEPYTLAMVLADYVESLPGMDFEVHATDLSLRVLEHARRAIYQSGQVEPVPLTMRRKYLLRSTDPAKAQVRIAPELRSKVVFSRLNLMDPVYPIPHRMHAIFCRNVLIYFDPPTQERVVRQLSQHLETGGYLFLGHAETIANKSVPLSYVAPTVYRKVP